jgi:PAS domain-containing protein
MGRLADWQRDAVEYRIERPDGETRWVRGRSTPILDDDGNVDRIVGFVRDITAHRQRNEELREKGTLLDQLFKQVPIHMYVKDDEARHIRVSEHHADDPGKYRGKTDREVFSGEFGEETYADDMRVIETEDPILDQEEFLPLREEWHLTSKVPWYGDGGEVRGLIGVTKSITERKQYERDLERRNERLDAFASVVSHDLRNPLQRAEGRPDLGRAERNDEHFAAIEVALERMDHIIETSSGWHGRAGTSDRRNRWCCGMSSTLRGRSRPTVPESPRTNTRTCSTSGTPGRKVALASGCSSSHRGPEHMGGTYARPSRKRVAPASKSRASRSPRSSVGSARVLRFPPSHIPVLL